MLKKILSPIFLFISFISLNSLPAYADVNYRCQLDLFPNNEDSFLGGGVYRNDSITFKAGEKTHRQVIALTYYTFIIPKNKNEKMILKKQNKKLDVEFFYGNRKSDGLIIFVKKDSVPLLIELETDYDAKSVRFQAGTYPAIKGNLLGYTKLRCTRADLWKDEIGIEKIKID